MRLHCDGTFFNRQQKVVYNLMDHPVFCCTLLGVPSCVRFRQQEFGEFLRPAWAVGSYSSGPPAGGTPQILVDKTSRMTGRLRLYSVCNLLKLAHRVIP